MTQRHREHDSIAAALRSWYTTSTPEAGVEITAHSFGFLSDADRPDPLRVLLTLEDPDQVPGAIALAAELAGTDQLTVVVDDRVRAEHLAAGLERAGCVPVKAISYLAHVGQFPEVAGPDDLAFVPVSPDGLRTWCELKLRCFDASGAAPSAREVGRELEVRQRELAIASLLTVLAANEPVGVLAYYADRDELVYNLGTIAAARHRGIARCALRWWVQRGRAAGARSSLINCDDPGRPQELYRSLGFTDEVYWTRRWSWRRATDR